MTIFPCQENNVKGEICSCKRSTRKNVARNIDEISLRYHAYAHYSQNIQNSG